VSLLVDRLAAYLEGQGEADIFKLHRPAEPLECVSLHATGGYPPSNYTERERPTLQIVARAATPDGALQKAYRLFRLLRHQQNLDLGEGLDVLTLEALNSPAYMGTESTRGGVGHLASFNVLADLRRAQS